jgi:toxin ParE1/3/4
MSRFVLSPKARADLSAIWDYTAETWDIDQAERYVRLIAEALELVAASPLLGRSCDHIREGYRKYPAGSHVLFYRLTDDVVDVVRILHRQMDFDRHLP